jgi:hypothetical protein
VLRLATDDEVDEFLDALASDDASDALVTHTARQQVATLIEDEQHPGRFLTIPDHSVIIGVHGDRGAMSYQGVDDATGEDVRLFSCGDGPEEPALYETLEFPPYCEIEISELAKALKEFLDMASYPTCISWQRA